MKKLIIVLFALFALKVSNAQINFSSGSLSDVMSDAKKQNKVLMVDVMTEWCKWCVELDMKVYTNTDVAKFANENQVNYKIDAENGEGIDFAKKYEVKGFPTVLFIDANGNEIDRIFGYVPVKDFLHMMTDYNKGVNTTSDLKSKLEKNPDDIEANLKYADKLTSFGKYDDAKKYLDKIVAADPQNKSGKLDDAKLKLAEMADSANVVSSLENFIKEFPASDVLNDAYVALADSYAFTIKDDSKTEETYKKAFELYPDYDFLKSNYGQYLNYKAGTLAEKKDGVKEDFQKGLTLVEKALPFVLGSVNEASSYYVQAKLYSNLAEYKSAIESIDKALKIFNRKLFRDTKEKILTKSGSQN